MTLEPVREHPIISGLGASAAALALMFALYEFFDFVEVYKTEMRKQTEILSAQQELDVRWERDDQRWNADAEVSHHKIESDIDAMKRDIREIRMHVMNLRLKIEEKNE